MTDIPTDLSWVTDTLEGAPLSPQHIDGHRSDRFAWEDAVEHSTVIQQLIHDHPSWKAFPALLQDAFQVFYKPQPELRPEAAVDPRSASNRPYVEQMLDEPTTHTTRTQTQFDELASAVATIVAGQKLAEQIAEQPDLNQAMEQQTPLPPNLQGALAKATRRAVQAAGDEAQDLQGQLLQWGLDPATLQTMPLGDRLTMARDLMHPNFRRLSELIGRLRNLARARQGGALRHLRDEYFQVTQGNDLSRVLPIELAALTDPTRTLDFGRRFLEGQLAQYDVRPIQRNGHGPILCAIDCSRSMSGSPIEWASAVGLALMDTARRQKRDFGAVFFNTTIAAEFLFPKGKALPSEILRFAQVGADGGTNFEAPLQWAMNQMQTARFKNADITLITDGVDRISEAFLQTLQTQKRLWGFRIFSILIGGTGEELSKWSDRVWGLSGQLDDEAAGELFADLVAM